MLCGCSLLPAQSMRVEDLGIGKLLVTPRDARDPAFAQSVILLVRYDRNGTLGLMLNRRTKVPVSEALRDLKAAGKRSDLVYMGGPVDLENVLALLQAGVMPEGTAHVVGKVYLVSARTSLEKALRSGPDESRVYLGYCGWGPGQLENEVRHGFWYVFPGSADAVFDSKPGSLWSRLIGRLGQNIANGRVQEPPLADRNISPFSRGNAAVLQNVSLSWHLFPSSRRPKVPFSPAF